MKKFVVKLVFFLLPLLIPVALYIIIDPYKLIHNFNGIYGKDYYFVASNRDYHSTELFLENHNKYDSYIFGNSRSYFYKTETWLNYIQGSPFHFNSDKETLFGINGKLNLIKEHGAIKNALFIFDYTILNSVSNSKGHLFIKHPKVSKEPYISFHYEMFRGFFPKAALAHIEFYMTKNWKPYMKKYGINKKLSSYDMITNQIEFSTYDSLLEFNPDSYYNQRINLFYKRKASEEIGRPVIKKEQLYLLINIHNILKENKSTYKIIISPLYDQQRLNPGDLFFLEAIFGKENVFDFSGINHFTNNYKNYYETSHYRPHICDSIMKLVYSNTRTN